jgi:mono/diheme cytochrome c family protein
MQTSRGDFFKVAAISGVAVSVFGLVLLVVFFAGLAFFVLAWRPSIAPIARPAPGSFPADLVGQGEALSAIGHCAACHAQPGGQPFAGGYPLRTRRILPWNRWGTVAEFERAPGTWEIEWLILLRFSAPLEEEESDRPC